jgi:hypothetical protein
MATSGTNWRAANSIITLRDQINAAYPNRNKASDGILGDPAHQAQGTASDHNINAQGVVCAIDITHDPANGLDVQKLADAIADSRDARIKYLIFNDRIMVPTDFGWQWVFHYEGSHRHHLHVSVWGDYDNTSNWNIGDNDMADPETIDLAFQAGFNRQANADDIRAFEGKPAKDLLRHVQKYNQDHRTKMSEFDRINGLRIAAETELTRVKIELAKKNETPVITTPASTTPDAPVQEPIDTKKVNWLVQLMINLFDKKK